MSDNDKTLGKLDTFKKSLERSDRPFKKKTLKRKGSRVYEVQEEENLYFAQIDFGKPRKRPILQLDKDRGPFYNPLTKRFYIQKLIFRDEDFGLIIQFDVILIWLIFGGILIWSIFF